MPYQGLERHEFVIPVLDELPKIRAFIESLYSEHDLQPYPLSDEDITGPLASAVHKCLDQWADIPSPSPFKICAAVTLGFMACPAIGPRLTATRIHALPKHQNAYAIFAYCRRLLHGAVIMPDRGRRRILSQPILVSGHFLYDLIDLLGKTRPSRCSFSFLALLYESLAYQANPKAQNSPVFG